MEFLYPPGEQAVQLKPLPEYPALHVHVTVSLMEPTGQMLKVEAKVEQDLQAAQVVLSTAPMALE